jgi:excisionase family DNA binding protein
MTDNNQTLANIQKLLLGQKAIMNIDELSEYTGLSKSALYKLTASKKFPFSRPNGKIIFVRKVDIDNYLLSNPIMPGDDIEAEAINYILSNPMKGAQK